MPWVKMCWAVANLLAVRARVGASLAITRAPEASRHSCSRAPPVSGAMGQKQSTASSSGGSADQSDSPGPISMVRAQGRALGRRESRVAQTSSLGSAARSLTRARAIKSPSRTNDSGSASPQRPPPVTYSQTRIRTGSRSPMDIIPVIDLKGGQVVHARAGQRDRYLPIRTPLAADATPLAVVAGLMGLHPFRRLYVADLDAIAQAGDHEAALADIAAAFPKLELWVDNGLGDPAACRAWLGACRHRLVLGSESQEDATLAQALEREAGASRIALSLDFRDGALLGPPALLDAPALWPSHVIVMTLARVGGSHGPDMDQLRQIRQRAPDRRVYAAGGLRNVEDLGNLAEVGAAGVLVASALHDGRLGPEALRAHGDPQTLET